MSVDPRAEKYPGWSPYNYVLNSPLNLVDPDGMEPIEPARNQAGTIQQAINQWRVLGLTTLNEIQGAIRNKSIDELGGVPAVRYVYTEERGWIDISHYVLVQERGQFLTDQLEWVGGIRLVQQLFLGEDADRSTYSYEDLPSNQFSSEVDLSGLKGEELFGAIEEHFESAVSTNPENAPNFRQIPFDDHDRQRIPKAYEFNFSDESFSRTQRNKVDIKQLLNTGLYTPQNKSREPYNLEGFDAANTSLEKNDKEK